MHRTITKASFEGGGVERYKEDFMTFMVRSQVLTFGNFTTKSGRSTPFFINTGNYRTGGQIARLGGFYAAALQGNVGAEFDVLFGPAYKGIPLVVSTAIALATTYNRSVPYCFNRKEAKDHGEGGSLVGHPIRDGERIVIIDDVVTAGTSVRESMALLSRAADVAVAALVVSIDRMERGSTQQSALMEIHEAFGIKTFAIVTLDEVITFLFNKEIDGAVVIDGAMKERIDDYRKRYGCRS